MAGAVKITLQFTLPKAAQIGLTVYNLTGRLVATLPRGWPLAGAHQVAVPKSVLAAGVYVCQLNSASGTAGQWLVKLN